VTRMSERQPAEPRRTTCEECGAIADESGKGWRGYRMDNPEEGEPPAVAWYCPSCAEREFGPKATREALE
jgi:RNase P subunit RPR2